MTPRLYRGLDTSNIFDKANVRDRAAPERFAESEYSTFSEYELRRLGVRHDCVCNKDIDEARSTQPALSAELEALFARLQAIVSDTTGSDRASELVGEMERAAAVTLHAALLECLHASGTDEETPHVWADVCAPTIGVPAYMPGHGTPTDVRHWGQLLITPPLLKWIPPSEVAVDQGTDCMSCDEEMEWLLSSFAAVLSAGLLL